MQANQPTSLPFDKSQPTDPKSPDKNQTGPQRTEEVKFNTDDRTNNDSPTFRRKKKKRIFSKNMKLPFGNSLSTSQHTHIFTTQDGNEKRLSLPIETIIEDVMEDPEHFLEELNESNAKDDDERQKILSAIKEINVASRMKAVESNAYISRSGKDLTVRRNVEEADPKDQRKKKNWRDKLNKKLSVHTVNEEGNRAAKEEDEKSRINEILKGFMRQTTSIREEEEEEIEEPLDTALGTSSVRKAPPSRKDTTKFKSEILQEGNVTKLSSEEMNYLEQKLTRTEEDQRIRQLIQRRKARELIEKRLKDIEVRFAEGAEQVKEDKQQSYTLTGVARVLRYQAKLIKLKQKSNLPAKLPDNIVYWNRLENRVVSQRIIKTTKFLDFYETKVKLHNEPDAVFRVCGEDYPNIKATEIWADKDRDEYTNEIEKKIHLSTQMPNALEKRECEGYIRFERARCIDVFFNSRFESGNLRQVYRVNKEADYEEIEAEDPLPDYLPAEELVFLKQQRKERQEVVAKMIKENHDLEDIEEEKIMKEWMKSVDARTIRRQEKLARKLHLQEQGLEDEQIRQQLDEQFGDLADDDDQNEEALVELLDENQIKDLQDQNQLAQPTEETEEQIKEKARQEAIREEVRKKFAKKATRDKTKNFGPDAEYNLYLQDDTQADSAAYQWYYFAVMNIKADTRVRLNIVNLSKPNSLYAKGMQPFVYSMHRHKTKGIGWHRGGENIHFFSNNNVNRFNKMNLDAEWLSDGTPNIQGDQFKKLHTLQFDYRFEADYDIVFFAHFVPYTYQDLIHYLCKLEGDIELKRIMRVDYLCNSLGQAPVYGLTITNDLQYGYVNQSKEISKFQRFEYAKNKVKPKKIKRVGQDLTINAEGNEMLKNQPGEKIYKKHIFITSRVHPGESQASHMVEGFINFLLSSHLEAEEIRSKFIIKIIPMLNPDGVIFGNYRSSLLGVDLNRRWKKPSKFLHPEVYYAKQIIKYFDLKSKQPECDSGGVVYFADFHGHSKNMDAFMYSCIDLTEASQSGFNNMVIRATPAAIDRYIPIFNIRECKFAMEREKENTARIVLFKEVGILASYTFEVTFFGSEFLRHLKHSLMMYHPRETVAEINDRYGYILGRKDIQVTHFHMQFLGEDLARGINFASKKRPLVNFWFRHPPKVLVEIPNPFEKEKDDVDLTLLELEKAWLPTGKVQQDRHLEIGEKFDALNRVKLEKKEEEMRLKEETLDDIAVKRRMEAQRKEAITRKKETEKKKKAAQQRLEIQEKKRKAKEQLMHLKGETNQDLNEIKSPRKLKPKKKKKLYDAERGDSPVRTRKRSLDATFDDYLTQSDNEHGHSQKVLGFKQGSHSQSSTQIVTRRLSEQSLTVKKKGLRNTQESFRSEGESYVSETTDSKPVSPKMTSTRNMVQIVVNQPISLPHEDDDDSDHDNNDLYHTLAKKILAENNSPLPSSRVSQEVPTPQDGVTSRLSKGPLTPKISNLPPISDRVTPKLAIMQQKKQKEKRMKQIAELSSLDRDSPSKRQVKLSMTGKVTSKMDSSFGDATLTLKEANERQLRQLSEHEELLEKETPLSSRELDIPLADIKTAKPSGIVLTYDPSNQYITQASIHTLPNLTQPESLEEKINNIFRQNRLSVDPLVVPSTKIDIVSKLKASTVEREKNQFQSAKRRKPVFAPANGVYTSQSLLQHPELAKRKGIHFTVGDPLNLNVKSQLAQDALKNATQLGSVKKSEHQPHKQSSIHIRSPLPMLHKPSQDSIATIGLNRNDANTSTNFDYATKVGAKDSSPAFLSLADSSSISPTFPVFQQRDLLLGFPSPRQQMLSPTRNQVAEAFQSLPALSPKYTVQQKDGFNASNNYHTDRKPKRLTDSMRRDPKIVLRPLMTQQHLEVGLEDQETRLKRDELRKSPRTSPEIRKQMIRSMAVQQMISSVAILDNRIFVHKSDRKRISDNLKA